MNCKDCKYWDCLKGKNYGLCNNGKIARGGDREIKEGDEARYKDASGYGAVMFMGEDFGCIHFSGTKRTKKELFHDEVPTSYKRSGNTYTRRINGHHIRVVIMDSCYDIDLCIGNQHSFDDDKHVANYMRHLVCNLAATIREVEKKAKSY